MQPMWLPICSLIRFASNATMHLFWLAIGEDIWNFTLEKNLSNATNATMHLFTQTIWENIWKLTLETSHSNATNVTMHLFWQAAWEDIWKLTLEKSRKNATNVIIHLFRHAVWQHLKTHSREEMQPMQLCICSGRHFEKTHSGEKSFKCNQWDYEFVLAGSVRRHLKTHTWAQLTQNCFTHSGEKTHHCGSSMSHTGEKPSNCAKCWFSSAESPGLNIGDSVIWSDPLIKAELKFWTVILVC